MAPWTTALVTGASSGIGTELARQLAGRGVDLVITARDTRRLRALAKELQDRNGVTVEVLTADLSGKAGRTKVEARLADAEEPPIDLMVNNAGFGTHGPSWERPIDEEERQIQVNVTALVRLTHAALGGMVDRGHGAVLNVSSMAGEQGVPGNAVYGATKAFVTQFSETVAEELRGTGVTLTALLPGFTRTEFQERAQVPTRTLPAFAWMEADEVARQAIAATEQGKVLIVPGVGNKVITATAPVVPRGLRRRAMAIMSRRV